MALQNSKPYLYAVLIGIDKYETPVPPLKGCVNDLNKVVKYLEKETAHFNVKITLLINEEATKDNIVNQFRVHLGKAGDGDTAFFYFSGHGTQEEADPIFWAIEEDRKHEALVCFDSYQIVEGKARVNLLADKELRFLLSEISPKNPHVLTIFDCCHSGGNTRNGYITQEAPEIRERRFINRERLSQAFPVRNWEDFIFSDVISIDVAQKQNLLQLLPEGSHIQMAACQNDQSAFEVNGEGVFTKNLLEVLNRCEGEITYYDLQSRILQYLQNQFDQKPKVYVEGEDEGSLFLGFLNKAKGSKPMYGNISYNNEQGWIIDLGAMHGISTQAPLLKVFSLDEKETYDATIIDVFPTYSILTFDDDVEVETGSLLKGYLSHYFSHPTGIYLKLTDKNLQNNLSRVIAASNLDVYITDEIYKADYCIQQKEDQLYISQPEFLNVPVIKPVKYRFEKDLNIISNYLKHVSQFDFVKNLHNSNAFLFNNFPVEVKILKKTDHQEDQVPIKHDEINLKFAKIDNNKWGGSIRISVKNISDRKLYCSLMYLSFNFEVSVKLLKEVVVGLDPNREVWALDGASIGLTLEEEISLYNYAESISYLKLIVSTSDFKQQASRFEMGPLPGPAATETRGLDIQVDTYNPGNIEDWTTRLISIRIKSPDYKIV